MPLSPDNDSVCEYLRQWVEEHPGDIDDHYVWGDDLGNWGETALITYALRNKETCVKWLIDTKGADMNSRGRNGDTALHWAGHPRIIRALLERNADPTLVDDDGATVLMYEVMTTKCEARLACLLEDKRVVDTVNASIPGKFRRHGVVFPVGSSALHFACRFKTTTTTLRLLLRAGADPFKKAYGATPMDIILQRGQPDPIPRRGPNGLPPKAYKEPNYLPTHEKMVAVLEEGADAQRAAYLLRVRRLVVARQRQGVDHGVKQRILRREGAKQEKKWTRTAAFVVGLGGEDGCPAFFFTLVMDMLLPVWSPLRKPLGGYKEVGNVGDEC
jgi:hypothetical protein